MPPLQYENNFYNSEFYHRQNWKYRSTFRNRYLPSPSFNPHFPCVSREIREKWLVNLTEQDIPDDVLDIACLGKQFGVPIINKKKIPVHQIIATLESNISLIEQSQQNAARSVCVDVISNFLKEERQPRYPELMRKVKAAKEFKQSNPEIVFLKADKGNVTVAVTRQLYVSKMSELLNDSSTYRIMTEDPTPDIQTKVNRLVLKWYRKDFITEAQKWRLWSRNSHIALSYGLPKIHKKNVPFRMIVSFMGTPTYYLAKYIQRILTDCMKEEVKYFTSNKFSITSSVTLVKKIRSLNLPENFRMISMDVVSLFTNVPLKLVIEGIEKRWGLIKKYTKISQESFIDAVSLCFHASAFQFNGVMYQQVFGAAMGSPLSPIVAEIVLQDLENYCLKRLDFPVYFYTRYVDDVLAFVPADRATSMLACFNSYHNKLQFTLESEENCRINFLEVTLIRNGGKIGVDWYRKPTSSGRHLNYYSHHPHGQKIAVIYNLVDRSVLLSDVEFRLKNVAFIRQSLIDNGYPKRLVLRTVGRRNAFLRYSRKYNSDEDSKVEEVNTQDSKVDAENERLILPYVEGLSEILKENLKRFNVRLSFRNDSNLRFLFAGNKDKLSREKQVNTVYKISCLECRFIFIEQTKRPLGITMREHYQSLREPHNYPLPNRLTEHAFRYLHDFDFQGVEVMAVEANSKTRKILSLIFKEIEFPQADESVDRISDISKIYSSLFHE